MEHTNFVQIKKQTYQERLDMYMKLKKATLASMLAQRDAFDFPDACTECVEKIKNKL